MTKSADDILRMLESLCTLYEEHAESGDLDKETSADIAELMGWMSCMAREQIGKAS